MTLFDTQWWIQYQKNFMLIDVFNSLGLQAVNINSLGLQAVNIKWLSNYNQSQRISAEFVDLSIPNQKNFTAEILKQMENFFTQKLDFQSSTKFPYTHPIIFFQLTSTRTWVMWERVRTSKITSLKVKKEHRKSKKNIKNQNIESFH
jgi:hypothetical protein